MRPGDPAACSDPKCGKIRDFTADLKRVIVTLCDDARSSRLSLHDAG
jgi:hypothetical protein